MPAQHLVPVFAQALHLSSRAQANALRALALDQVETPQQEWNAKAAAALLLGANWAGEPVPADRLAAEARVPEQAIAKQFQAMADRLKKHAP